MITRRSFIRGIAAGATLAVVGMSPALAAQKTITTDIVVVGAGSSGLAAAVQAAEKGAKVVLLEKNPFVGGNSQHAEGLFAVESEYQRLRSDPQTREDAFRGYLERHQYEVDPSLWGGARNLDLKVQAL